MDKDQISILTYNIFLNRAYEETAKIIKKYRPDIVCVQECSTSVAQQRLEFLELADKASNANSGLAAYYNPTKFELISTKSYELPKSIYEKRDDRTRVRQQIIELKHKRTGKVIFVSNIHLVHLVAPNSSRRRQLVNALNNLAEQAGTNPKIVMGDFNYPFFSKSLEAIFQQFGLFETGKSIGDKTHKTRGKFDRIILSKGHWTEDSYKVLDFGKSDHAPILSNITIRTS